VDLLKPTLKSSTLIESLTAMVIVLLSFGIGTTIFSNVTSSSPLNEKTRAEILLKEVAAQTIHEKKFLDSETESAGIKIVKKVSPYNGANGLSILSIKALNRSNKVIAERNQLIFSE
jgi:hypothetical protein